VIFDAALRAASKITLKTAASAALRSDKRENAEHLWENYELQLQASVV
jgi:hypothetical protein